MLLRIRRRVLGVSSYDRSDLLMAHVDDDDDDGGDRDVDYVASPHSEKARALQATIGLLRIDVPRLCRHLKSDFDDDWFPDPLNYEDLLAPDALAAALNQRNTESRGRISASPRQVRNVPKKNGAVRYSLETTLTDRAVYHALVDFVAPELDDQLELSVFSHRLERGDRLSGRRLFKGPIEMWRSFELYVGDPTDGEWLLSTDIQDFFANIQLAHLDQSLQVNQSRLRVLPERAAQITYAVEMLIRCLREWMYTPTQGLPQNRDASSFLANQLLASVDREMISDHWVYARYMDDIRIRCKTRAEALRAAERLSDLLRRIGLSLNAHKTAVRHDAPASVEPTAVERVASMWNSRSLSVIGRSLKYLLEMARTSQVDPGQARTTAETDATSRQFRFAIERLSRIARCKEIVVDDIDWRSLIGALLPQLLENPEYTDKICVIASACGLRDSERDHIENLLGNGSEFLYEWQRYLLTLCLLRNGKPSDALVKLAREVLDSHARHMPVDIACIVLGASERPAERRLVLARFIWATDDASPFAQRCALIAVHELDWVSELQPRVRVHPANLGVLRRLVKSGRGRYVAPVPEFPIQRIARSESAYV
jgi:hypothetical protein